MTETDGARIDHLLDLLHWSHALLARVLDVRRTNVQRWCNGTMDPPANLLPWLEALAAAHRRYPLPEGWDEGVRRTPLPTYDDDQP
jgi:transcriptional regulator with XRE-family HTH domain